MIASNSWRLAVALLRQGRAAEALPHAQKAVEIFTRLGSPTFAKAQATLAECEAALAKLANSHRPPVIPPESRPMHHDLLECLPRSSQSEVWRARDRETGAIVAVKKPGGPAQLVAIRHPHVVRILECDAETMVMEWIEGTNLEKLGQLDATSFDALIRQSLSGLAAIHEAGLLHLDLKPENILRSATGFLISDFGSAKRIVEARADLKGSVHYMAPECFEGAELDERTDLYALGCVFYLALTGETAFQGELAPQVITAHLQHRVKPIAGPVGEWIERLMARKPQDRPASASEALAEYPALAEP